MMVQVIMVGFRTKSLKTERDKMKLRIFQIDAFAENIFCGNPACVVPLKKWLPKKIMLNIAKENAVAETAFFIKSDNHFKLRWFTPETEMDLCGHATLATAHAIHSILKFKTKDILFKTKSGNLLVQVQNGSYYMNFPSRKPIPAELPLNIKKSLNYIPVEVYKSRDYLLVYENESKVKNIEINRQFFDKCNLKTGGVIITSKSKKYDFVSRFFTPKATVFEDPVTGSAHCTLIPFWGERLNKDTLDAMQISPRGGKLKCENKRDRVVISGKAKTYSEGFICIDQ